MIAYGMIAHQPLVCVWATAGKLFRLATSLAMKSSPKLLFMYSQFRKEELCSLLRLILHLVCQDFVHSAGVDWGAQIQFSTSRV